jgi:predicted transcriptional regulator
LPRRHRKSSNTKVGIKASVKPDYIICLEDGKKLKMLKAPHYDALRLTPQHTAKNGACRPTIRWSRRNYAEQRRVLAKSIGLGKLRKRPQGRRNRIPARGRFGKMTPPAP